MEIEKGEVVENNSNRGLGELNADTQGQRRLQMGEQRKGLRKKIRRSTTG